MSVKHGSYTKLDGSGECEEGEGTARGRVPNWSVEVDCERVGRGEEGHGDDGDDEGGNGENESDEEEEEEVVRFSSCGALGEGGESRRGVDRVEREGTQSCDLGLEVS